MTSRGSTAVLNVEEAMESTFTRSSPRRLATVAAVIGLVAAACGGTSPSATSRSSGPSTPPVVASASPAPVTAIIPDGRYAGTVQQVSNIVGRLQKDTSLTESERAAILDDVLEIRGATTYQTTLDARVKNSFDLITTIDGKAEPVEHWTYVPVDDHRFVVDTDCCGVQVYEVAREGGSIRLTAKSPASSNVERFVRGVVFEAVPFTRAP